MTTPPIIALWLGRTEYGACWRTQCAVHALRLQDEIPDLLLLTEHGHTYTTGRRRGADHLLLSTGELQRRGISLYHSDRGGDITYHGPGQLVGYPILRLRPQHGGVVGYLRRLELGIVRLLAGIDVAAHVRDGYTGAWTRRGKIASIGVRLSAGVTLHGFALNVEPDLGYFDGIIPCGIEGCNMTSIALERPGHVALEALIDPASRAIAETLDSPLGEDRNSELFRRVQAMLRCA